jgi:hypothetical protein
MIYLFIGISALVSLGIGNLWYGFLFKKTYNRLMGFPEMDCSTPEAKKAMTMMIVKMMGTQLVLSVISVFTLVFFGANALLSVIIWFGFVMPTTAGAALWSGKPTKDAWKLFLITSGCQLLTFTVYGLMMQTLPW